MVEKLEKTVEVGRITLRQISKSIAKSMVIKNHYTHKWTLCRVAYGIFYKTTEESDIFLDSDEKLIGCIIYGQPVGRSAAASLTDSLNISQVFELTRLFIFDGYGKNIESYCISKSFRLLNKEFPNVKAIISYADGEQGHTGRIYQATGFIYQGNSSLALMPNYGISLSGPPDYKWIHSRTVTSKWGSHNVEHLKKCIGKTFWRKKESAKHRYVKFISTKGENKRFERSLKHPSIPYPKTTTHIDEIEKIDVIQADKSSFF